MGLPWLDVSQGRYYLFAPMSFRIDHAHSLPLEQAVERIRALGDYLNNKHGIGVTWTGPHTAHVKGNFMVVKIDVDLYPELSHGFGIQAVPTFVIVFKGVERARTSGALSEENFSLWVASKT